MKREEKDLLLKDLCARLPYGVKIKTKADNESYTLLAMHPNKDIAVIGFKKRWEWLYKMFWKGTYEFT